MVEKKKIKGIGDFESYENAWEVTFSDGAKDVLTKRVQKGLKALPIQDREVEFQLKTYLLDKNDVKKLQALA